MLQLKENMDTEINRGDVKYGPGNRVGDAVITMHGDRWLLVHCSDHFVRGINVKFYVACMYGTNIIMYANNI